MDAYLAWSREERLDCDVAPNITPAPILVEEREERGVVSRATGLERKFVPNWRTEEARGEGTDLCRD